MKNYIRLSVFLCSLIFLFCACNIEFEKEHFLSAPSCKVLDNANIIGVKQFNSDTLYINLYRQDITGGLSNPIENIGIIYPLGNEDPYLFTDELILKDHEYIYYARIYDGTEYYNTLWSEPIKNINAKYDDAITKLPAYPAGSSWVYSKTDYKLTYTLAPIPNYSLTLIAKSGDKTLAFELEQLNNGVNETVSLTGILPHDFYDTPVTILGICGQKIEMDEDTGTKKQYVYWTKITPIAISGEGITNSNTFTISSSSGGNIEDYSRQLNKF